MRKWIAAAVLALTGLSAPAFAGFAGNSLRLDYFYPNLASSLDNITVAAPFANFPYNCCLSTEFTPAGSSIFISVDDDTIVIEGQRSQVFDATTFNGVVLSDALASIDAIIGVILVQSTLPGLDASDIGFGADRVLVNFAGASGFNLETWRVELQVTFARVAEPGTLALMAIGFAGLASARRRKN